MSRSVLLQLITYTLEVKYVFSVIFSIFLDTTENLGLEDAASKCNIDAACRTDMDTQHVPGHAAWTWTRSMCWDMRHGHRFAAMFCTCPCWMSKFMSPLHVHVHAACSCVHTTCPCPFCMCTYVHAACPCPCLMSMFMSYVHVHAACMFKFIQNGLGHAA